MKCEDCKFWEERTGTSEGYCHRNAPICYFYRWKDVEHNMLDDALTSAAAWPSTELDDWCGEFQSKEKSQ